jgi:hypothetical protein
MEAATSSFTSRRPAAVSLPAFSLPSPASVIPRAADGISPSLSSVNTGSSQGSQPHTTMAPYTNNIGHGHGTWQTPGHNSYNLSSAPPPQLNLGSYTAQRPSLYSQNSSLGFGGQRDSPSPTAGSSDVLPPPPDHHVHQPFPTPLGGHPGSGSASFAHGTQNAMMSSHSTSQSPSQSHSLPHLDTYGSGRGASGFPLSSAGSAQPAYPSYASLQSPNHASPTTASPGLRGLGAMAPPAPYRAPPFANYGSLPGVNGAVLSNVHHPGGSMSMVGGMGVPSYHGHAMIYGQPPPTVQERPFKCDICVQAFSRNHDLKRHKRIHLSVKPFPCPHCTKSFSRKDALKRHKLVKGCDKKDADKSSPEGADIADLDDEIKRE